MEVSSNENHVKKQKFQLYQHPWLSVLAVYVATILSIGFVGTIIFGYLALPEYSPWVQFLQGILSHILTIFILVPYVLYLPKGNKSFTQYLDISA